MTQQRIENISPIILQRIGSITLFVGNIEFWIERTIWGLSQEVVTGKKPSTDSKPISALIKEFKALSQKAPTINFGKIIELWAETATPAFNCRNSILHGVMISYEDSIGFLTNTRWEGEIRRRDSASFIADEHTLNLLYEVFSTLLNGIIVIENVVNGRQNIKNVASESLVKKLIDARSTARELENLTDAINNEKY